MIPSLSACQFPLPAEMILEKNLQKETNNKPYITSCGTFSKQLRTILGAQKRKRFNNGRLKGGISCLSAG